MSKKNLIVVLVTVSSIALLKNYRFFNLVIKLLFSEVFPYF